MMLPLRQTIGWSPLALLSLLATPLAGVGQSIDYPAESVADQAVPIRVLGLRAGDTVTLRVESVDAQDVRWVARATFRADATGIVDTGLNAPEQGGYSGRKPAGLFSHALPADGDESRRFATGGLAGVETFIHLEVDGVPRDSVSVVRHLVAPALRVSNVSEPAFRGRLFSPESPRGGGVVVLGGSEGGFPDGLAALLAANGYVALSVPYFGVEDLPPELAEIPLETVVEAVAWLRGHPRTSGRVALFGTSKGAEAALLASTLAPGPVALVAYAPSSVAWSCICSETLRSSWTWRGESLPAVGPGADDSYDPAGGPIRPAVHYLYRKRISPGTGHIAIEQFDGPILLVAGEDDQLWPSHLMAQELMARRAEVRGHPLDRLHVYADAGHLIGKAFLPSGSTRIARGRLETGGSRQGNAAAQADAWPKVLAFLERVLR
ncbi:MAG: acyl-CoA thioesterase/BAAT N-terminal domain-containing protein [Gemmatimonadetes bacterium]|nr:acyl-CoA thioesterase/BAAT N-terminal domain-containing protein [Gemmatimonadota bacterium]